MDRMTDWKRKKLWLGQEPGQVYTRLKNTNTTGKQLKQWPGEKIEKKTKTIAYTTFTKGHYPRNG